jgi:hypothetical protein
MGYVIIEQEGLMGEFFKFASGFLEIRKLTSGSDYDMVGDLFVAVDANVF